MSLPDPMTVATNPVSTVSKIVSPAGQSVFRKEFDNGATMKISFFQNGNKLRSRHLARLDYTGPNVAGIGRQTLSVNLTIDEPADNGMTDADVLYFYKVLRDTLTDVIIGKMLNQEL